MVKDGQVRKLMKEMAKSGRIGLSAQRSGMSENTARKYLRKKKLPSELKEPRDWRTRKDPFAKDWEWMAEKLELLPGLQAKTLFGALLKRSPGEYQEGQLRTLQRRVRRWRGLKGPEKEVFFPQEHRAGERLQTDWTVCDKLKVTIGGEEYPHKICHSVLPYSNWESGVVCRSEGFLSLKKGLQEALMKLGCVPKIHQTDHSTAACHRVPTKGTYELNQRYKEILEHYGIKGHLIGIGKKEQNGDVESSNRALKNRLEQYILLRGGRDFESVEAYQKFVDGVIEEANIPRRVRFEEELKVMRRLEAKKLPEYEELEEKVGPSSTIRVKVNTYSVPSRLIGEKVKVRLFEERLEVRYGGKVQFRCERLLGKGGARINYRHIIWSLVKKPGAFERYKHREELFPSVIFREAWDEIQKKKVGRRGDLEYLRILHLAASTMESEVETALVLLLEAGQRVTFDGVKSLMGEGNSSIPSQLTLDVNLDTYNRLTPALVKEVLL